MSFLNILLAELPPWQATLSTLTMSLTTHVVRAVAEDGLGQTGFDDYDFELVENLNMPVISFNESDGAVYVMGDIFSIDPSVEDDVGVRSIHVFIASATNLVSTNASPILINTTNLALGTHRVIVLATNNLGVANDRFDPDSYLEFTIIEPPPGVPPAAPMVTGVSPPEGLASKVTGTSVANARINIRNTNQNVAVSVYANSSGAFTATINANVGNVLSLVAYDFTQSPDPSPPTVAVVPPKPVIMSIRAYPSNAVLPSAGAFVDLVVTGFYQGGSASNVTGKATFSSSVPSVASVSSAGRVVALKRGAATISAAVGSNAATAEIFADIVKLTNITAAPKSVLLAGVGNTRQLAVTGQYNNGTSGPLNSGNTFVSGNPAIATVSLSGLITAVSDGLTQISVYRSGLPSAFVNVSVDTGMDPPPTVDILSPPSGSGVERNELVPVSVRAQDPTNGVTRIYLAVSGATTFTDQRQISPSKKDTTQVFNFTVSSNAPISGVITVRTWAVDTSAHTSTVDSIVLQLGDGTSPQVFISSPIPETAYGYGETVTVVVVASDAVGVKRVRCYATGALSSDETRIYGASVGGTNEVFSISVPFGAPYPDVTLHAEAWDDENNKGTAINVPIVLSDADITPPATEVTAVADPGVGTTATVTYEVTDGLDDLDHVEIYFRRDGYGTFNRYTDADGGNSLGHYDPGGVAVGSLIFDSAKMGGDGTYEFYSIGVDQYGNRGLPPTNATGVVTADEVRAFSAGTVWITISSPTNISLGNTAYDNVNLRIDGVTVTINGHHMFHNVELLNGAVVTHPDTTTTAEYGVDIDAWTVTVDSNSAVNVDELGYLGGEHAPNTGMNEGRTSGNVAGSTQRSGGSYGGTGGAWGGTPCALYGDLTAPSELGSGGSRGGSDSWWGGDGGGKILIQAINIVNDGLITSDGQAGHGDGAGGGSGGSVYLIVTTASGRGDLTADGGGNEVAGGGGRIAVHYVDIDTWDTTLLHALGGQGNWVDGGNGTVFLKGVDEGGGTLVVDGQGAGSSFSALPIPPGHVFDNIIIRNTARVVADDELVVSNKIEILTGSIMTHSLMLTDGVRITCKRLEIDSSSSIDVGAKGYRGGERDGNPNNSGFTLAEQMGSSQSAGGSYGGYGGASAGVPNPVYGSDLNPAYLGSGGSRGGSDSWAGGNGGGRVTIEASEAVVVEGVIRADGQVGAGDGAGGGSGGSIKIDTSLLRGSGSISANGGGNEIGGGGGRILIDYDYLGGKSDDLNDLRNIGAFGGSGTWSAPGGAGTVVMRRHSQSYGDLYVDDNKVSTSTNYTWLTHVGFGTVQALSSNMLLLDQTVRVLPGGLVGLEINPDLTQQTTFDIIGNSATSITVDVSGGTNLTDVAAPGDGYAAIHRFDNIFFRRGGSLRCGDKVVVGDTVRIDEHGKLTHFKATTTFESRLDLTVGTLELSSNGYINADAVGYLGGEHHQNVGVNSGRTENNSAGSTERAGGSYGGLGGHWGAGAPNSVYGSMTNPEELGSGGSRGGSDSWWGGDGGGWVRITAGAIANDGIISANGQGGHGDGAGGGSGGTIDIHADSLSGSGIIRANGGGNEVGGGGGRIAIRYNTLAIDQSHLEARAGSGNWTNGGNGTLFLKHSSQTYGDLVVDGHNVKPAIDKCPILDGYEFDNIIFRNKARVTADAGLNVAGALRLQTNSVLTHTLSNENGLQVHANNIEIDAGSSIDVTARGYRGGERPGNTDNNNGLTLAGQIGSSERSGGSFGGYGASYGAGSPNPAYGDPHNPIYLGSGGSRGGSDSWAGGSGGGRIDLVVSNDLTVNGTITAAGGPGHGDGAGGGSGGSVKIQVGTLRGTGTVSANGGGNEVGGAGGRIGITYGALGGGGDNLNSLSNVTVFGGSGSWSPGSAGTIVMRQHAQTYGDLYIDDNKSGSTSTRWTPLTRVGYGTIQAVSSNEFSTDQKVALLPGGLVGLTVNPNLDQTEVFTVSGNTATSITVDVSGGTMLTDVASIGDTYAAVHVYDNVFFRRGGFLVLGDVLHVTSNMVVAQFGGVTHFDASTVMESRLQLLAERLQISSNSSINVIGRGYLGGEHSPNINFNSGRTLNNATGSSQRSGGSYGGLGGAGGGTPNPVYGTATNPAALGSGGSRGGSDSWAGGDGGGWIRILAGSLDLDGVITADGSAGGGDGAGGGSGGTIYIETGGLTGNGTIRANGGGNEVAGGGGRVAVYYPSGSSNTNGMTMVSAGGSGSWVSGSAGTVYLDDTYAWTGLPGIGGGGAGGGGGTKEFLGIVLFGHDKAGLKAITWDEGGSGKSEGGVYLIEFSPVLPGTNWMPMGGPVTGVTTKVTPPEDRKGYFRVRKP